LLQGRAQWNQEGASVSDHVINVSNANQGKIVKGLFIAPKVEPFTKRLMVTAALQYGYVLLPLDLERFLSIVERAKASGKGIWKGDFDFSWENIRDSAPISHGSSI
ncbi:MAG: hypothetical protein ACYCPW_02320, partial [Nitrososphaerales archaeon]